MTQAFVKKASGEKIFSESVIIYVEIKEKAMKQGMRLTFRKGDWIAVGLVIVLAAVTAIGYLPKKETAGAANVQIYQDGQLIRELPLDKEETISVSGAYTNQVTICDGRVKITESDCPGGDCVHSGWISEGGRSIVCLPNRVEVRIAGASEVDFVVQ